MPDQQQVTEDPLVGRTFAGRFEILAPIARGGMGRVYRALQKPLGRQVAIKLLDPERGKEQQEEFRLRFSREAATTARLTHPNTIVIHDYGKDEEDNLFIAMELLHGHTLYDEVQANGPLSCGRATHIVLQVAGSIAEAHAAGLVHRDVKPGNIMLINRGGDQDFVKVLDFGLVKDDEGDDDVDVSSSNVLMGTPRYMAPEQILGGDVGPATDIYSLGGTFYFALTGRPPFESDSRLVLMTSHIGSAPTPMSEANPDVEIDPEIESIVMRCLSKEPEYRFESMEDLAEALRHVRPEPASSGSRKRAQIAPGARSVKAVARPRGSDAETVAEPRPERRKPVALVAALVGLAALLTVFVIFGPGAFGEGDSEAAVEPPPTPDVVVRAPEPPPPPEPRAEEPPAPAPTPAPPEATPARVVLSTMPAGARVHRGGEDLGDTPLTLLIPRGETWSVHVSAPGYVARELTLSAEQPEVTARLMPMRRAPVRDPGMTGPRQTDNRDPWAEER